MALHTGASMPPYAGFSNETYLRRPTARLTTLAESVRPLGAADCVQAHRARERSDRSPLALPPPLRQPGSAGSGSPPCTLRNTSWRSASRTRSVPVPMRGLHRNGAAPPEGRYQRALVSAVSWHPLGDPAPLPHADLGGYR